MNLEYDYFVFEYGCVYDCIYVRNFTNKLHFNGELYMVCTNTMNPFFYDNDCLCFEKYDDAIYYILLMKNNKLFIEKVHCFMLCKLIKNSNHHIGVVIKKKASKFMRYIQYIDITKDYYSLYRYDTPMGFLL